jgi:hypothetical protein
VGERVDGGRMGKGGKAQKYRGVYFYLHNIILFRNSIPGNSAA